MVRIVTSTALSMTVTGALRPYRERRSSATWPCTATWPSARSARRSPAVRIQASARASGWPGRRSRRCGTGPAPCHTATSGGAPRRLRSSRMPHRHSGQCTKMTSAVLPRSSQSEPEAGDHVGQPVHALESGCLARNAEMVSTRQAGRTRAVPSSAPRRRAPPRRFGGSAPGHHGHRERAACRWAAAAPLADVSRLVSAMSVILPLRRSGSPWIEPGRGVGIAPLVNESRPDAGPTSAA